MKVIQYLLVNFSFLYFLFYFSSSLIQADYLFLKTGEVLEGEIVKESEKEIFFKDTSKKQQTLLRDKILRVVETKSKMGKNYQILYFEIKKEKVYVEKKNGESFFAYLVSQDLDNYTFRFEMNQPQEFIVKRTEVLNILDKAPSNLKIVGKVKSKSVELLWSAPKGIFKKYHLFIKNSKEAKYELAITVNETYSVLTNLKSNMHYLIKLTGEDENGFETLLGDEIEIDTPNILPMMQNSINFKKNEKPDMLISWEKAVDPDGQVISYNIYLNDWNNRKILTQTKETQYNLNEWMNYKGKKIEITALDNLNGESLPLTIKIKEAESILKFNPVFFYPIGRLGEMAGLGYGLSFSYSRTDLIIENTEMGIDAGYINFQGKTFFNNENQKFDKIQIIPIFLNFGFSFYENQYFTIDSIASIGAVFVNLSYIGLDTSIGEYAIRKSSFIDSAAKIGLSGECRFMENYSFNVKTEFGAIIEKEILTFFSLGIGIGYSF